MSENPKFEVIDRRKFKAEEEKESQQAPVPAPETPKAPPEPAAGPRLVVSENGRDTAEEPATMEAEDALEDMPPAPTAEESKEQAAAYEASAERIDDLIRAQNPGAGTTPPATFESLVQQFYLTAMLQMGAGTQAGERPRVDIVGARGTIDLLGLLAEKTKGNLTAEEDRMLQTALFDARMAFLELSSMISMQGVKTPPPPKKR